MEVWIIIIIIVLGTIALYPLFLFFLRFYRSLRRVRTFRRLERHFQYHLVWGTRITWIGGVCIVTYLLINGAVLLFLRANTQRWAGVAAAVNSIPLFLGGRRNLFIHFFGLNAHAIAHSVVGLVVIVEGLLHAGLTLNKSRLHTSLWDFLAASALLSLLLTSVAPVRRCFCFLFGSSGWWLFHLLSSIASLVGMAGYVGLIHPVADASLSAVVAIYLSGAVWTLGAGYRYIKRRRTPASVESEIGHPGSTEIMVRCSPPLSVFPGCYFYLYNPRRFGSSTIHFDMFNDSLPLALVWDTEAGGEARKEKLITFVIAHGSRKPRLAHLRSGQEILLDGPHGRDIGAAVCTTMVLAAQGPGIVGLLSFAYYQVDRFRHKKSRKEKLRVDILWVLSHASQQDLVGNKLEELQNMDPDSNTVLWLLYPAHTNREDIDLPFEEKKGYWAWYRSDNYRAYLRNLMLDCPTENCIVIACGDATFSAAVRRETADQVKPAVRFAEVQYRPRQAAVRAPDEESRAGHRARSRSREVSKARLQKKSNILGDGDDLEEIELTPVKQRRARTP